MPLWSAWNDPVVVSIIARSPAAAPSETEGVTGSIPRPATARSVGFEVATSAPCSSIWRAVAARTPPAE